MNLLFHHGLQTSGIIPPITLQTPLELVTFSNITPASIIDYFYNYLDG